MTFLLPYISAISILKRFDKYKVYQIHNPILIYFVYFIFGRTKTCLKPEKIFKLMFLVKS